MTRKRYFKCSKDYFKFLNAKKRIINIISVQIKKKSIRVDYENKSPEEIEAEQIELQFDEDKRRKVVMI